MVTTRPPKTIVKPTALGPVANTDTKLLICGLFQKGRVLAQDGIDTEPGMISTRRMRRSSRTSEALSLLISLLPEQSASKARRTEVTSCIVRVWISET